jgi:hypothetical protein
MISGFSAGTLYHFKVQAFNEFGQSPESAVFSVLTASVPLQLTNPADTAYTGTNQVLVTWAQSPGARGSAVTGYRIKFKTSTGTYAEAPGAVCTSGAPATTTCTFLMSVLTAAPFSLAVGANIIAAVEAQNAIGYSAPSVDSTTYATVRSAPTVAPTLSRDATTSETAVVLAWTAISTSPANGASAVTTYTVYRDTFAPGSIVCTVAAPALTCTPGHAFVAGTTYSYLITATNAYGEGVVSGSLLAVQAATRPDAIASAAVTAYSGATVEVTWAASANARSNAVTSYSIEFKHNGGAFSSTAQCLGTDPQVVANRRCYVPMSVFETTYALPINTLIEVRVAAINGLGTSDWNALNIVGATAKRVPTTAPTLSATGATSDTQVVLTWTGLSVDADTGASPITNYKLYYDNGDGAATTFTLLGSTGGATTFTQNSGAGGITGGTVYRYQIVASNVYGDGPKLAVVGSAFSKRAAAVPDQLAQTTTVLSGGNVVVTWAVSPNVHGSAVTAYRITFKDNVNAYSQYITTCDGTDSAIIAARQCTVPMTVFSSTYSLTIGAPIIAVVEALNTVGYSTVSADNTVAATVKLVPQEAPVLAKGVSTNEFQV